MEPNPTKTDKFLEEIKDCNGDEYCILELIINFINESDVRLLEPAIQERKSWKNIREPDCKVEEQYGLWLGHDEAATEIESVGGDYDVTDYTSIVGLGFPPNKEKNTPFLKTTVTVKAPNLKAAFVRGTEALQRVGGSEEFVSELPKCEGNKQTIRITMWPKKNEDGEWVVAWYDDGKYNEDKTYYTDDKDDAIRTMADMKKRAGIP